MWIFFFFFFFFFFVECRPVGGQRGVHSLTQFPLNAQRDDVFANTCQKIRGGKHVKVKKRRRQDIMRFLADARTLILGSIGTPLDQLSVKLLEASGKSSDTVYEKQGDK